MSSRARLSIGSLALVLGASGILLAPAATAASPYGSARWSVAPWFLAGTCTGTPSPTPPPDTPLAADGRSHTINPGYTAEAHPSANPADSTKISVSQHVTGSLGSSGTNPSRISMAYSGRVALTRSSTSQCSPGGGLSTTMNFTFTLSQPRWVDISFSGRGNTFEEVYIADTSTTPYVDLYSDGLNFQNSGRWYLPAGSYRGYMTGSFSFATPQGPFSDTGAVTATFRQPGIRSAGPTGKARPYLALAAARDCTRHTLATRVTTNKKRARTIKKIVVSVNGHKVRTARAHLRGRWLMLSLADSKAAAVRATVTTVQKKKHHRKIRKTRTVAASYLACN